MSKVDPLLQVFRSSLLNRFNKLVKPMEKIGLNIAIYTLIRQDGNLFQIGNFPDGMGYYWDGLHYKSNPFIRDPKFYSTGSMMISEYPSENFQKDLLGLANYYNSSKILACFFRENEDLHWVAFSSSDFKLALLNIFLNERALLEKFSQYIINEWKPFLKQTETYMVDMSSILGSIYHEKPLEFSANSGIRQALLKNIGINASLPALSGREFQCLFLLLDGKTAPEIGNLLNLSHRTVETYIANLKNKLVVNTKGEIIEKARSLIKLGILKEPN